MRELTISRPLTLKGRPGSILEITHGSILVDFELGSGEQNNIERFKDVFVVCECHLIYGDRANLVLFKEEMERDEDMFAVGVHPAYGSGGPLANYSNTRSIPFSARNIILTSNHFAP